MKISKPNLINLSVKTRYFIWHIWCVIYTKQKNNNISGVIDCDNDVCTLASGEVCGLDISMRWVFFFKKNKK